jgi:hypothetical protein
MRRVAFMCLASALVLGLIGWDADGRPRGGFVQRPGQSARSVVPPDEPSVLPRRLAKKRAGHVLKRLPFGLAKPRADKAFPPGVAKRKSNHGQCVSRWAHEATAEGLSGRAHGRFVSSVAEDRAGVGRDCDMQAALHAALKPSAD